MTRSIAAFLTAVLMLAGLLVPLQPAAAAELSVRPRTAQTLALPFPRSERAQSVWASGACQKRMRFILRLGAGGLSET